MLNSKLEIVKPSRYIFVGAVWIICVAFVSSCASDRQSSHVNVKKIDGICGRLPGSTLGDATWQELDPYLMKRDALQHLEVKCIDSCEGSLALQDAYFVDYFYMSPKHVDVTTRGARISQPRANWNRVYAVVLRRGEKTIQSYATSWEARRY
jgi:hypothetical protein